MGDPLSGAALHETVIEDPEALPVGLPGASGADVGCTLVEAVEYEPVPCSVRAATRKMYVKPLVNPRTVAEVAGAMPSLNVVQVEPLLELN